MSRLEQHIQALDRQGLNILSTLRRGMEKEGLRVDAEGFISQLDHPEALGSALTHPNITTDYSEALLELITPVTESVDELFASLSLVHRYVQANLPEGEVLWPASMPSRLAGNESIRIAEYGTSNLGMLKHVYRRGLDWRYGRIMQSIAGAHFNFSLTDRFWMDLQDVEGNTDSLQDFKSARYFDLIRNFRRHSWLLMRLFGGSPAVDESFLAGSDDRHGLVRLGPATLGLPHATSLRMSDLGYQNNAQAGLKVCFNTLASYHKTLYQATHTPYPPYEKIGVKVNGEYRQLNTSILQIENEYYSNIRPKRVTEPGEKPLQALCRRGVEYIEVRCLDLNPYAPLGIKPWQVFFLEAFLLTCLLEDAPVIPDAECERVDADFARVVRAGGEKGLALTRTGLTLEAEGEKLLTQVRRVADWLADQGEPRYRQAVDQAHEWLMAPELTPAARILKGMKAEATCHNGFMMGLARLHQQALKEQGLTESEQARMHKLADQSLADQRELEAADTMDFDAYLARYMEEALSPC
ncbi:MAG: glutamate--cysteine ligase [Gammaproteobacteria bacterium]|nr:MAG: glutamate--cysteine ligase [Gammaproteobacteria bacterium]